MRFNPTALASFEHVEKSGALTLPLSKLIDNKNNPRTIDDERSSPDWPDFVANIAQYGILEPLLVSPPNARGESIIHRGHRRKYGGLDAGLKIAPVRFTDSVAETEQPLALMLDNHHRSAFDPYEEACYLQAEMTKHGLTQQDLCERGNLKKAYVSARLLLCQLSRPEYDALKAQATPIRDIENIARAKKQSTDFNMDVAIQALAERKSEHAAKPTTPAAATSGAKPVAQQKRGAESGRAQSEPQAGTLQWIDSQLHDEMNATQRKKWQAWRAMVAGLSMP
jgi:ParB/RepB/Spo0J family partition protein